MEEKYGERMMEMPREGSPSNCTENPRQEPPKIKNLNPESKSPGDAGLWSNNNPGAKLPSLEFSLASDLREKSESQTA